jgi:DNA polymerase-3 subunit gamma/tau
MIDFMKNHQIDNLIKKFDQILDSGYELRQFILSLAQHFRDLLISKDSKNENFIEYSLDIINKYSNQSKNMTYKTLVECLDECNKADINYNISSNKKILIELSLYKINQLISSESDNESTKADKNIEKEESVHEKITEHEITLDTVIDTADKSDNVVQPKSRTLSINALSEKDDSKIQQNSLSSSEEILSQEILQSKWSEFIKKLQEDKDTNLMIALSNFTPKLKDNNNIEVYVSNTSQKEIAISRLSFIKTYLSKKLSNDNIQINLEVSELDEKNKKPYTNSEKFKEMVNQNPNLEDLRSKFDLDYDY